MLIKNLLALKKVLFSFAVGWTILVAYLCLISFKKLPSIGVSDADKYVHFTLHFIFTLLWQLYSHFKLHKIRIGRVIGVTAISLSYGILIEFLQETLTTTRQADVLDVLANFTGALLASAVFVLIKKIKTAK